MALGKGSVSRVVIDLEATPGVTPAAGSRRPIRLDFNTSDLRGEQNQNQAATITGDRNQAEPFLGNKNVQGTMVIPVDRDMIGYFWLLALGDLVTTEDPSNNTEMVGAPNITISGGTGSYTFDVAQVGGATLYSRVVYTLADGTTTFGYITTRTDDSTGVLSEDVAATVQSADGGPFVVVAVVPNLTETPATPGTIDIVVAAGVATATLSVAQTTNPLAVGQAILYDTAGAGVKRCYVSAVTSTTVVEVVDGAGQAPAATGGAVALNSREGPGFWIHTFKTHPTNELPSVTVEQRYQDIGFSQFFAGCKVNTVTLTAGGDGELTASFDMLGFSFLDSNDPYENDPNDTLSRPFDTRYNQFDAVFEEGGSPNANTVMTLNLTFANNLDETIFPIGAQGTRTDLPEGFAAPSGTFDALFRDTALLDKAAQVVESSLKLRFEQFENPAVPVVEEKFFTELFMPETKYQPTSPPINGPQAIQIPFAFQAYFNDSPEASALQIRMRNKRELYT